MMKIKIFFSEGSEEVTEREGPLLNVDLSSLERHYHEMGERHVKSMARFQDYWRDEGAHLMVPKARVAVVETADAEEAFGPEILRHLPEAESLVLAVWTLGEALERESSELMSSEGAIMTGFLLDVAGSVALYSMHDALLEWLEGELNAAGKSVRGEFYPGFGGVEATLMEKLEQKLKTCETIGVKARGVSMLHPRKTQCAFVGAGAAGTVKTHLSRTVEALPCVPCGGKRCLYYQLGGCHMNYIKKFKATADDEA